MDTVPFEWLWLAMSQDQSLFGESELYKVWVFYPSGYHTDETDWVDIETAQKKVISLIQNVGARIGTTQMIRIVDLGDDTVFQWEFGKGVTYPPSHGSSSVQT